MKVPTQLLMLLVCTIGTTFTGQSHSTQITPGIKIAKMKVLKQRLQEAQRDNPNIVIDKNILKYFAGKSFANGGEILEEYAYIYSLIAPDHLKKHFTRKQREQNAANNDADSLQKTFAAITQSVETAHQEENKVRTMQPLILELTLKSDYPAIYDQLKSRLTPPAQ